ncbi:MAG: nucleotidyltransferase substrate binding protein [Chitinophagaceae bacterium]
MPNQDIRWQQRFQNFSKALSKLEQGIAYVKADEMKSEDLIFNDLIKQGLIQSFEFTHELAWNVVKDYAAFQGNTNITGSRDAAREGFAMRL